MRILGIDPGLNIAGYALVEKTSIKPVLLEAGLIRTKTSIPLEQRLFELYNGIEEVILEFKPGIVSVEEIYSHYKHPRTAVIMGHARGIFFLAASKNGIPVYSYSATRIKKSLTGTGHATKEQVAGMICSVMNYETLDVRADVTDAVAAALCHISSITHGGEF